MREDWERDVALGTHDGREDAKRGVRRKYLERYPHVYREAYEKAWREAVAGKRGTPWFLPSRGARKD